MKINRKRIENVLFGLLIVLLLIPKTRAYFLRLISFSPSIEKVENRVKLENYNWSLKGINIADYDFNQAKSKVVIINHWATWCVPCVAEMPSLESLYKDYGDKVDFLLITSDTKEVAMPFMKKNNFSLPIYNQISTTPKELTTQTIPRSFLINKKGEIVIDTGRADWNTKKIRKLLDALTTE